MLAVESMLDVLPIWVDLVQNRISITLFTSSEGNYLEIFAASFEKTDGVRPDRNINLLEATIHWNVDLHVLWTKTSFLAVEKSFIQVQNQHLFAHVLRSHR